MEEVKMLEINKKRKQVF